MSLCEVTSPAQQHSVSFQYRIPFPSVIFLGRYYSHFNHPYMLTVLLTCPHKKQQSFLFQNLKLLACSLAVIILKGSSSMEFLV